MIPHTGLTQEIVESIDPHDTMTLYRYIKVIDVTELNRLIDSRCTSREALADTETTRAFILTAHAHQVVFASETDNQDVITNIHVQSHLYARCHVLDVVVHNIHLMIENVLHHLNKSKQA